MAGFQTGAPELYAAAKHMEETNSNLQSQLSQLANAVESVQGAWGGKAASAFQVLMAKYSQEAKDLNNSLQSIAEQVTGSAKAYEEQEEAANQSVSSITSTLGG